MTYASAPVATVDQLTLWPGVEAWFTTRAAGNLAHRRPHVPSELAHDRRQLAATIGLPTDAIHFMRQVHSARVGVVDGDVAVGAELRDVDVLVTELPGRALAVQVADCVPLLLAGDDGPIAAAHAGRVGIAAGVVEAALAALRERGAEHIRAALGPAIGACCYEVPGQMRERFAAEHPAAHAVTTRGTPALDLPAAVRALVVDAGGRIVADTPGCTACTPGRWFSHRADASAGRQLGVIVRRGAP